MSGIKVADIDDVEEGGAIVIDAARAGTDDDVALFRTEDDQWYALNDTCTHEDASLADGWIEGAEVECPLHAARFCLKTGAALCLPATVAARTYKVDVREGEVFLDPSAPAEG